MADALSREAYLAPMTKLPVCFSMTVLFMMLASASARALIFECRNNDDPSQGYLIAVEDTSSKLQDIVEDDLNGPVLRAIQLPPPSNYSYVLRILQNEDRQTSKLEIWISQPEESTPLVPARAYNFAPSFEEPRGEIQIEELTCQVVSEPTPRIFRSEI